MAIVTGDRYLESLVKFVENEAGALIEGSKILKLNPVGLHYVQSRLEALEELESLLAGAPVDYLRAYVSDLGDHRALEQLRRILRLLTSLKVVSVLEFPARDPTPLSLLPFGRLKVLELRGCDLSTSAARGLLHLRLTLEKIICHNSTDALRHVFASRIVEIKDSPQWNRLSFVSCACNDLLLMDESLQLLPAVETLDLSRNKFAKVDNLRKCTKLKHLDLGFNHLRTISSFGEVSCQIVKLVLRNNALTTLRGIEKLNSLEGLDISYNIISNFFELEILADIPSLENLWLEGNPLCAAGWYRAQVFSFFPYPDKIKLDEKKICTEEFWKRQLVIASRQKRPASFGFYSPAKDKAELEGSVNTNRKKITRLASIDFDGQSTLCSDQDSVSCDIEIQSKEENVVSDEEAEIADLINRIEVMKKERSNLWLQEFQVWMNRTSENLADGIKHNGVASNQGKEENYLNSSTRCEPLRYVSDSAQASGGESSANFLESETSCADNSTGFSTHQYCDRLGEASSKFFMGHTGQDSMPVTERIEPKQKHLKSHHKKGYVSIDVENSLLDCAVPEGDRLSVKNSFTSLGDIADIKASQSSLASPGSPPHYQEDILHRRNNLVEELLQLSAESYSVASSDSYTSHSEDDSSESGSSIPRSDKSLLDELSERSVDGHSSVISSVDSSSDQRYEVSQFPQNGKSSLHSEQTSGAMEGRDTDISLPSCSDNVTASGRDNEIVRLVKKEANWLEKKKCKRKPIKRVVSLSEEHNVNEERDPLHELNGSPNVSIVDVEDELGKKLSQGSDFQKSIATSQCNNNAKVLTGTDSSSLGTADVIVNYFNSNIADFKVQETCRVCMSCICMLEDKSGGKESEAAVVLSSEQKLYILINDGIYDGSGIRSRLIGCHRTEDVKEVLIGLGLQVVRVCIERDATYTFVTGSIEKSRQLLEFFNSHAKEESYSLRSLELVQVELFERYICGASNINMFQYSILFFQHINMEDDMWFSRSLFVLGGHLLVCVEDYVRFGSLLEDTSSSSYFSLASCCSIVDVLEMVLETRESRCVTLSLKCDMSEFVHPGVSDEMGSALLPKNKRVSVPVTWKLKWLHEENQVKFVTLLKALYYSSTMSPLVVRYL